MGGWLNPSILFIMRRLLTATLLAAAQLSTTAGNVQRAATTINTKSAPVYTSTSNIYYIKTANKITLNDCTIELRGYQNTTTTVENDETVYTQKIDYYVKTNTTLENISQIEWLFTGSTNSQIDFSIDEYLIQPITDSTTIGTVNLFLSGQYDYYSTLEYLKNNQNISTSLIVTDAGASFIRQDFDQVYNYVRVRLETSFYGTPSIESVVAATQDLYTQLDVTIINDIPVNPTTYEVVDIGGLMFEILGMPFAWISIAFNLTLWPGTPYAINISRIAFVLISSLILIFIIKKVIK